MPNGGFKDLVDYELSRYACYPIKWLWYNSDDGEDESDFTVEDVLYHYDRRESSA